LLSSSLSYPKENDDDNNKDYLYAWMPGALMQLARGRGIKGVENAPIIVLPSGRHPHIVPADSSCGDSPSPPWLDGRTSCFVQLALIAAREAIRDYGLDIWLGCCDDTSKQHTITTMTMPSIYKCRKESCVHQERHVVHEGHSHDIVRIHSQVLPALHAADTT
jgi:hypothetical protein